MVRLVVGVNLYYRTHLGSKAAELFVRPFWIDMSYTSHICRNGDNNVLLGDSNEFWNYNVMSVNVFQKFCTDNCAEGIVWEG